MDKIFKALLDGTANAIVRRAVESGRQVAALFPDEREMALLPVVLRVINNAIQCVTNVKGMAPDLAQIAVFQAGAAVVERLVPLPHDRRGVEQHVQSAVAYIDALAEEANWAARRGNIALANVMGVAIAVAVATALIVLGSALCWYIDQRLDTIQ